MRKLRAVAVVTLIISSSQMFADQLVLKNGDRLSGIIEKSDGKTLVIKTEFAGEVTVQWPAIQEISSTQPLHVGLHNGKSVVGPVATSDGNLVATTSGGAVTAPIAEVSTLRNDGEEAAYEKSQHPGMLENWQGGTNVGFALTRGNSETKNLALAFTAQRLGLHDKIGLYVNTVYATNDAPAATPHVTANTTQGGIRYDHDLTTRLFGFVNADFQTDALQDLNLRSVLGGGLGFHAIKNDRTTLNFLGGANYTRENYSSLTRNFAAATLGEEFTQKLGAATSLVQKLYIFPDLSDPGEYRGTFNFSTVTKMSKWLGWQNSFGDIYVTNPPAGKKQNDIVLTTGLNLSFAH